MAGPKEAGERGWTPIFAGSSASATRAVSVRSARTSRSSSGGMAASTSAAARERRGDSSGTMRASICGVSDGLVSNLSLVMGVVGAAQRNEIIVLAGVAGLLAGAFSMAAGEWISMQSQRELFERQIELEREELAAIPQEEEIELGLIYRRKGFTDAESASIARRLMSDPKTALDTLVREELGLDPDRLRSPWGAAGGSVLGFSGRA